MPRKDKGFARLKNENIELNTFHGSESDDDDDARMIGGPSDCAYCGTSESTKARWNLVVRVAMVGLLCSSIFLFMYFAYRDSQMTGRLNELEDMIEKLSSTGSGDHPSVTDLAKQLDVMAKQLNTTTVMLTQSVEQVKTDCHDIANKQNDFVNSKASLLDTALKQISKVQLNVNSTLELLARLRATVDGYDQTKADHEKLMGNMEHDIEKLQEDMEKMSNDMEKMSGNMAAHQAELKRLEGIVLNHTELLTNTSSLLGNTSSYFHQHVDQLHLLLTNMNVSMATEMSRMWNRMTQNNLTSINVTTSNPLDIIAYLLDDPVFMTNISLKIASMVNGNMSHNTESVVESPPALQLADNVTKLQDEVEQLGEGLQQMNRTLQTVKTDFYDQLHAANVTTVTAAPSAAPTAHVNTSSISPNVTAGSSSPNSSVVTSSATSATNVANTNLSSSNSTVVTTSTSNTSNSISPNTTTSLSSTNSNSLSNSSNTVTSSSTSTANVSNSLEQALTTTGQAFSSTTVINPSPTLSEPPPIIEDSLSLVMVSTGGISSVMVSPSVTSPVVNESAVLVKRINVLQKLLQLFNGMDRYGDHQLHLNETKFTKQMFDMIDKNGDTFITEDEIKELKTEIEERLNTLEMSTSTEGSYVAAVSTAVQLASATIMVETTSKHHVFSSPTVISSSSTAITVSSSPGVAVKTSLLPASPSSTGVELLLQKELEDAFDNSE